MMLRSASFPTARRCIIGGAILRNAEKRMVRNGQRDPFRAEEQPDLFGDSRAPVYRPDPDKVRARLYKILAEARTAQRLPWEPTRASLYRRIFPQMTLWLPEDEGAQLRFEFETELVRLEAA
jgi:hypothetical protein